MWPVPAPPGAATDRSVPDGRVRRRSTEAVLEAVLLVVVLWVFDRVHSVVATDVDVASANAGALQAVERVLHLDVVLGVNRWLVDHPALVTPAVLVYRLYYVVLLGVLVWVFVRHPERYRHVRRVFVALCGLALLVYWAVPMSPPRFALAGAVDVIAENDILGRHAVRTASSYTAMPSVHVAWSAWAAYAAWYVLRGRRPRAALLVWAFPALMVAVVFATANHYVLDVVGSAAVLAGAIGVAHLWGRLAGRRAPGTLAPVAGPREAGRRTDAP